MSASLGVIDRYVINGMLLDSVFNIFLVTFKHISSELFFHKVSYTMYDVPLFIE
jgi:hypothetical protein